MWAASRKLHEMPKIHGAEKGEKAQEFFYREEDGTMKDADLHEPILRGVDYQIDETIMSPIRTKYRKMYADVPLKKKSKPA
jgi:hypothetical protein